MTSAAVHPHLLARQATPAPDYRIALAVVLKTVRRACAWQLPPNWSFPDWHHEIRQVALLAVFEGLEINTSNPVASLEEFLSARAMVKILCHYRRERRYGCRCTQHAPPDAPHSPDGLTCNPVEAACPNPSPDKEAAYAELRAAVQVLPEPHRSLVIRIFWAGLTESTAGASLGLSQSAVSRRKAAALQELRARMTTPPEPQPGAPAIRPPNHIHPAY